MFTALTSSPAVADEPVQVREPVFSKRADGTADVVHRRVRKSIVDEEALFAAFHEGSLSQGLEMLRRVGERQSGFDRERVDGPFPLGQELEHLEPVWAREDLSDAGELSVQPILELAVGVGGH